MFQGSSIFAAGAFCALFAANSAAATVESVRQESEVDRSLIDTNAYDVSIDENAEAIEDVRYAEADPYTEGGETVKKVRKKAKKAKDAAASAESEMDSVVGGIVGKSKQEPNPGLYKGIISLSGAFSSTSSTDTVADDEPDKSSRSMFTMSGEYEFILGRFGVGPLVTFTNSSNKTDYGTGASTSSTSSDFGFGGTASFFFSDVQTERIVPYVSAAFVLISGSGELKSTNADGEEQEPTKSTDSGNRVILQGGLHYFMVRHLALVPLISYQITSTTNKSKNDDTEVETTTKSSGLQVGFGLSKFL